MMRLWLVMGLICVSSMAQEPFRSSCGGDGPDPLVKIPFKAEDNYRVITTQPIREFKVWERRSLLVYTNDRGEVRSHGIEVSFASLITHFKGWFDSIVDTQERYLVQERGEYLYDVEKSKWHRHLAPGAKSIFWNEDALYLMSSKSSGLIGGRRDFYRYDVDLETTTNICSIQALLNKDYKLAEGSQYPLVRLYEEHRSLAGLKLSFHQLNLQTCQQQYLGTLTDPIPGPVKKVRYVPESGDYIVRLNHPTLNTLWLRSHTCEYFDIDASFVTVAHHQHPMLIGWKQETGLTAYSLGTKQRSNVLSASQFSNLRHRDVYFASTMDKLFVAPVVWKLQTRQIVEIDLKELAFVEMSPILE